MKLITKVLGIVVLATVLASVTSTQVAKVKLKVWDRKI